MLSMQRFSGAVLLLVACGLLAACGGGSSSGDSTTDNDITATANSSLTYFAHTKSIIDTRCVSCHQQGGQASFALTSYFEVKSKESAIAYVLKANTMPPPGFEPLRDYERALLGDWLKGGAKQGKLIGQGRFTPYTYYGHVKAILDQKCANCHRPDDIAPFSLTTYAEVYPLRSAIAHQVKSGAMPPWPPTKHYLPIQDNRSLSDADAAVLDSWIKGGAPEGSSADHVPRPNNNVEVDYNIRVSINQPYTPASRPDEYRCLMVDWPLDKTVYIDAVTVVPDAVAQVHHVFAVVVSPENVAIFEDAEAKDGRPGFNCWGAPSPEDVLVPPETLTVWAPGKRGGFLPEGTGIRIEPGSKIAMQMHYNTINSEPVPDQSSLDIHYVDEVERTAATLFFLDVGWVSEGGMPIPAGDPNVTHQYEGDPAALMAFGNASKAGVFQGKPFALHSAFMHQHVLGKSTSVELLREDGTEVTLIDIRNWDFDWQDEYFFEEELIVQPGDRMRVTCTWDNSASNQQFVHGKQIEPQYTEFGEGTVDEMCVNYFFVTRLKDEDIDRKQTIAPSVAFYQPKHLQAFQPGDYVPIELIVNAFTLQEPGSGHIGYGHDGPTPFPAGSELSIEPLPVPPVEHNHQAGHYYLYLDAEDDSADHLTRWEASTFYLLPEDILPGEHTLRVSLRSDDHEPIGEDNGVKFLVVEEDDTGGTEMAQSLIDAADWKIQEASSDSLSQHRPAVVDCPANSWYEEDGALEVETGYCNYLSATQPIKASVNKGDNIHVVLWHGQLRFDQPEEAHVAISLDGTIIWEDEIEIPNDGGIYDITVPSTVSAKIGDIVEYHLHNHGYNTWTLLVVDVERVGGQ